jgi:FAD/FMN-containing dehydrogenase
MQAPSADAMLQAWERGQDQGLIGRGLTLLSLACPDRPADDLCEFSIGARDRALLGLRAEAFGRPMRGLVACPECGERLETDFDAAALAAAPPPVSLPLSIAADGYTVQIRLPDSRDLLACDAAAPADPAAFLLRRCIVAAERDGLPVAPGQVPDWLAEPIGAAIVAADPQSEMRFAIACAACGHRWDAPFEIVTFLWAELDAWAERLVQDIHLLARSYGWAERDIIGLGTLRRDRYLRLIAE